MPLALNWDDARRAPGAAWGSDSRSGSIQGGQRRIRRGCAAVACEEPGSARYHYLGPSFGWEQQGHFYESSWTERRRSIDVTVLHRANVPINRHVTFSWLVGGGFVYRPEQFDSVTKEVLPDGQLTEVNTDKSMSSHNYLSATARLDVEFRVAPHVSVSAPAGHGISITARRAARAAHARGATRPFAEDSGRLPVSVSASPKWISALRDGGRGRSVPVIGRGQVPRLDGL